MHLRDPEATTLTAFMVHPAKGQSYEDLAGAVDADPVPLSVIDAVRASHHKVPETLIEKLWQLALRVPPSETLLEQQSWALAWERAEASLFPRWWSKNTRRTRSIDTPAALVDALLATHAEQERMYEFLETLIEIHVSLVNQRRAAVEVGAPTKEIAM